MNVDKVECNFKVKIECGSGLFGMKRIKDVPTTCLLARVDPNIEGYKHRCAGEDCIFQKILKAVKK